MRNPAGKMTGEYNSWANMIARCENKNKPDYKHYGGRGITVSPEWRDSYWAFLDDMGRRPSVSHTLERIDNNKGYQKGNCRWATRIEQANNTRSTRLLTAFGKTLTVSGWATERQINRGTIKSRLKRGWTAEKALSRHIQTNAERSALVRTYAKARWSRVREASDAA